MVSLLLSLLLMSQGLPVSTQQAGTVTGVLKGRDGKPLPGIRMAAVAKPDSLLDALTSAAMSSIAETDAEGRYKLDNVPSGRYYIAAGRLDLQTYYPGTPDMSLAKDVAVTAGTTTSGVDFEIDDASLGRAERAVPRIASIALRVTVEGGAPFPVSGSGSATVLAFKTNGTARSVALTAVGIPLPGPAAASYSVTVEGLPETYVVKSMMYGSTDVMNKTFQVTPANALAPAYTPPVTLSIVLARTVPRTTTGVRVSGRATNLEARSVYLSGIPGDYYADGTFEVHGVPPGLHVVATGGVPFGRLLASRTFPQAQTAIAAQATSVVVGTENLDGVMLVETLMVPESVYVRSEPRPAGNRPPGTIPLARLAGKVVEEVSRLPIREGKVTLKVGRGITVSMPITAEGGFEFPPLFPGTYDLEVSVFGHTAVRESIEIADTDVKHEVAPRKL
jgi:hypothetical protein